MEILTGTVREVLDSIDQRVLGQPSTTSIRVPVGNQIFNVEQVRPGGADVSVVIVNPEATQ